LLTGIVCHHAVYFVPAACVVLDAGAHKGSFGPDQRFAPPLSGRPTVALFRHSEACPVGAT
jgi:hypothetical protein